MKSPTTYRLTVLRIVFIIVATFGMFGGVWLYSNTVHYPALEGLCAASCANSGLHVARVESGYAATTITEGCLCEEPAAPGTEVKFASGYFFSSIEILDWFLLVLFRLIPITLIGFVSVLFIAKIVARIS